ncbi:hypothetical protein CCHR01_02926 [Colletotrichum chrysophilum]|uniref:Uncharacterized protein n=1 Tax=Colletotrichum chrysophilum TaxID=1836956 RepID=A0AAD9AXD5_9PEZI|nr:hypothetical protein CCHR01_02926 [Colletotrichum chrysophilum]
MFYPYLKNSALDLSVNASSTELCLVGEQQCSTRLNTTTPSSWLSLEVAGVYTEHTYSDQDTRPPPPARPY